MDKLKNSDSGGLELSTGGKIPNRSKNFQKHMDMYICTKALKETQTEIMSAYRVSTVNGIGFRGQSAENHGPTQHSLKAELGKKW